MATGHTTANIEPIDAMIQKANSLLAEAQALGGQYIAHSENIINAGWSGQACITSHATAMQVKHDLDQALAASLELHEHLNNAKAQFLAQQADSSHTLSAVHPGASPATQM
jgi:paraquat-inducible protein B